MVKVGFRLDAGRPSILLAIALITLSKTLLSLH